MSSRRRAPSAALTHQPGVCDCERCAHPLLVDLPPARPKGREARRRRLERILDETRPDWTKKEPL